MSKQVIQRAALAAVVTLGWVGAANAADKSWDGGAADSFWNYSSLNWNAGAAFVAADNAIFGDTGAGSITLATGAGSVNVSAGTVLFDTSAVYNFGAVDATTKLALDGFLTTSGVLTKSGTGSVTLLHGLHTFGGITVNNGRLTLVSNYPTTAADPNLDNNTVNGPIVINAGATLATDTAATKATGTNGDTVSAAAKTLGTAAIQLSGGTLDVGSRGVLAGANFRAIDWSANTVSVTADSTISFHPALGTDVASNHSMWLRLGPLTIGNTTLKVVLNENRTANFANLRFINPAGSLSTAVQLTGSATFEVSAAGGDGVMISERVDDGGLGYDLIKTGPGRLKLNNSNDATPNDFHSLIVNEGAVMLRTASLKTDKVIYLGATSEDSGSLSAMLLPNNRTIFNEIVVRAGNSGSAQFGFGSSNPAAFDSTITLNKDLYLVAGDLSGSSVQTLTIGAGSNTIVGTGIVQGIGGIVVNVGSLTAVPNTNRVAQFAGSGANTYSGTTTVMSGILRLNKTAGTTAVPGSLVVGDLLGVDKVDLYQNEQIADTSIVTLNDNATFDLRQQTETVGAVRSTGSVSIGNDVLGLPGKLVIATNGGPSGTSVIDGDGNPGNLTLSSGSQLDVKNNRVIFDYPTGGSTLATIKSQIISGRNGGTWDGAGIITSMGSGYAIGYAEATQMGSPATFGGQAVDDSAVFIKGTYAGDANLDGQVTISDLGDLASNWQSTTAEWVNGDFNYDGSVTISDLGDLASNWQAGVGLGLGMSFQQALAAVGLGAVEVPEPASIFGAATMLATAVMAPRRRRRPA